MKQLLFLLLFPCLALAQYPGNSGQKITLGEQTTADGLVYRGVENDTALITPLSDTSAYIILDTVNNKFYNYNRATNVWSLAGGGVSVSSFSAGTTGLTPSSATTGAVTLGGTLAVANGGTNTSTLTANKVMVGNGTSGVLTPTNLHWDNTNSRLGIGTATPAWSLEVNGNIVTTSNGNFFSFGNNPSVNPYFQGDASDNFYLGTKNDWKLKVAYTGEIIIRNLEGSGSRAVNAAADGTLSASSSITIKENVNKLSYGLDKIMQLQPKSFNYIDKNKYGEGLDIGFIAEDVYPIVPEATGTMNDGFIYFDAVKLIPILTKAIQEQQALIKALEQRILILENK